MTSDVDIVVADNVVPDIVVPDIVVPDIVVPDIVVTDYVAEPDYSPNVSYDYESKNKLFNCEEAKNFALQWVNNLDTQYRPCTDLFLEGLTTLVTNADDQVTLDSLDNVLAGAIDLEAK